MKRDMELIRELLFKIEETAPDPVFNFGAFVDYSTHEVVHHLCLLQEAGLIHPVIERFDNGSIRQTPHFWGLKWEGCEYLDTIRDEDVWRKTKAAASQAGGFSLKVLAGVATGLVLAEAKRLAGVP